MIHRDVKPANILLSGSVPKLTDFGIAALRETTASMVAYTLNHCPPETFADGRDNRDERSDLYSMASTLYTLLTGGRAPFDLDGNDSQQAYMFRIIGHAVPDLPEEIDAPESLRAFLRSALAKHPDERPASAAAFMARLEAIRNGTLGADQAGRPDSADHRAGRSDDRAQPPLCGRDRLS